jgi:hypothetical protein
LSFLIRLAALLCVLRARPSYSNLYSTRVPKHAARS